MCIPICVLTNGDVLTLGKELTCREPWLSHWSTGRSCTNFTAERHIQELLQNPGSWALGPPAPFSPHVPSMGLVTLPLSREDRGQEQRGPSPARHPGRRSISTPRSFSENRPAVARQTDKRFLPLFPHNCAHCDTGGRGSGRAQVRCLLYPCHGRHPGLMLAQVCWALCKMTST